MKHILYDFICPHSASAFVFCSCKVALAHTHIDEGDREGENIEEGNLEMKLYQKSG